MQNMAVVIMLIIVMHNLADIVIKSCGKQGKADEHTRNLLKSSLSSYTTETPRDAVSSNCGDGDSHDDHVEADNYLCLGERVLGPAHVFTTMLRCQQLH